MASPVSQETLQLLRETAEETAKQFGISYGLHAAWTLYERAREAAETNATDNLKLTYREFDSVERTDLLAGYVDVRVGEGPGAMRRWKKVYCVEKSDYGIEFYANQGAYEKRQKPKTKISPAGYRVLTRNIAKPFRRLIEPIAEGLGVYPGLLDGMVNFPNGCWALFHPQRTKYVFRICKTGKKRFGKKPLPNIPDEDKIDRNEWIDFLQACVRRSKPRNTDTVMGMAFERTCEKISDKVDTLEGWKDEGTEDEMLLEMLMASCLPEVQDIVLEQLKGYLSIPFALAGSFASIIAGRVLIPLWYTAVGLIKKTIQGVLGPAWAKIQQQTQVLLDKIEPTLRKGLTPITKIHNKIIDAIKHVANKTIGRLLSKHVTPLIDPLIEAYAKPLTEGFSHVRKTYRGAVMTDELPKDAAMRKDFLDGIPRKRSTMKTLYEYALQLSTGLEPAKRLIDGAANKIGSSNNNEEGSNEEDEDAEELCAEAEDSLLKGLDATVYTLQLRAENGEKMTKALKEKILTEAFDHDAIQLKREVVKTGVRNLLLKYFMMVINADGHLKTAIGSVDEAIPSEMQDFLSLQSIFDALIVIIVGEPIDRMVEAATIFK